MFLIGEWLSVKISRIVVGVSIGVVDDLASREISTLMVAHMKVVHSGLDCSCCDLSEGTMIVTVDW